MAVFDDLETYVLRLSEQHKSADEISRLVGDFVIQYGFVEDLFETVQADSADMFAEFSTVSTETRQGSIKILKNASDGFRALGGSMGDKVAEVFARSLRKGDSRAAMRNALIDTVEGSKRVAETIARTGRMALSRAVTVESAIQLGMWLKLVGVGAQRPFCVARLDKVFPVEQVRAMDNGQGLIVLYYCGGFNCVHTWQPVSEEEAKEIFAKQKIVV